MSAIKLTERLTVTLSEARNKTLLMLEANGKRYLKFPFDALEGSAW